MSCGAQYTRVQRLSPLDVITVVFGLIGGLSVTIKAVCEVVVGQLWDRMCAKRVPEAPVTDAVVVEMSNPIKKSAGPGTAAPAATAGSVTSAQMAGPKGMARSAM